MIRVFTGTCLVVLGVLLIPLALVATSRTGVLITDFALFLIPGALLIRSGRRAEKGQTSARSRVGGGQLLKCAGCESVPPNTIFVPGQNIAGYAGFGRCEACGKIWCQNCDVKVDLGSYYAHRCPRCNKNLSNYLFG